MTTRTKINLKNKFYVERNRLGQIKKWVAIRSSLKADIRQRAKRTVRSGKGHLGDQKR